MGGVWGGIPPGYDSHGTVLRNCAPVFYRNRTPEQLGDRTDAAAKSAKNSAHEIRRSPILMIFPKFYFRARCARAVLFFSN